jgi:hypothetical protein
VCAIFFIVGDALKGGANPNALLASEGSSLLNALVRRECTMVSPLSRPGLFMHSHQYRHPDTRNSLAPTSSDPMLGKLIATLVLTKGDGVSLDPNQLDTVNRSAASYACRSATLDLLASAGARLEALGTESGTVLDHQWEDLLSKQDWRMSPAVERGDVVYRLTNIYNATLTFPERVCSRLLDNSKLEEDCTGTKGYAIFKSGLSLQLKC